MKLKSEFLKEIHSRGFIYQSSDIENYRIINSLQEKCRWKSANKYILKITI